MRAYYMIFIVVLFIVFFLQKCTTVNITTSNFLKKSTTKKYPYLEEEPSSESYILERLMGSFTPMITYDASNNYYLLQFAREKFEKRDAKGRLMFSLAYKKDMDYADFSGFVFSEEGVYDFRKKDIFLESFKEIMNKNQEMDDEEWKSLYETFYKKATTVVYGETFSYPDKGFKMYFLIDNEWICLFTPKNRRHYIRGGIAHQDRDLFPAKYETLVLLKDERNNIFSNTVDEDDTHSKAGNDHYTKEYTSRLNIDIVSTWKSGHAETMGLLPIPTAYDELVYYKLNINSEHIKFKESAMNYILGERETYINIYQVPDDYIKNTEVYFLEYKYLSNLHNNRSKGMYIIKNKKNN